MNRLLGSTLHLLLLGTAVSLSGCAPAENLFHSQGAGDWKLELSTHVLGEHSIAGRILMGDEKAAYENRVVFYSSCDRSRIALVALSDGPSLVKRSLRGGEPLLKLVSNRGEFRLEYLGMGQGTLAFALTESQWSDIKNAKWAKLTYVNAEQIPGEIRLSLIHLPQLMSAVDEACE